MRIPWTKSKSAQLDLLDAVDVADVSAPPTATTVTAGQPLLLPVTSLYEDPNNPRTEVPDAELDELVEDTPARHPAGDRRSSRRR